MFQETLRESVVLRPDITSGKGVWRACLIAADVQGSSGYYPADVLARDGATAFPAGTHIYFDHPTQTEEEERPERSVREMAGVLLDDAKFEESPDGRGLFARVKFFEDVKDMIGFRAEHVGLSIRAAGQIEETPQGQRVVRSISHGLSVDLVTRAGAGGRLVNMTESAQTPESPPAVQSAAVTAAVPAAVAPATIPSTTGTGALVSEVGALKESVSDRLDQVSVDLARNTQQLKEAQRELEKQSRENAKLVEAITYLKERAESADARAKEAKSIGDTIAELLEAKLPMPSMIRLAQTFQVGQDLHEAITHEREYLKKLMRETERGSIGAHDRELSGLGLTESATFSSSSDAGDMAEIRSLLGGGSY